MSFLSTSYSSNTALAQLQAEIKQKGETLIPQVPTPCAKQLKAILIGMNNDNLSLKHIEQKRRHMEQLKKGITNDNDVAMATVQDLMKYLSDVDILLRNQEKYCYLRDIFVSNLGIRILFFLKHPQLFKVIPMRHTIDIFLNDMFNSMAKLPTDQMKQVASFGKSHNELDQLIPHAEYALDTFSKKFLDEYSQYIDDATKQTIISTAQQQFANVGNNKLLFFKRPNQVALLDDRFAKHINTILKEYLLDYIASQGDSYTTTMAFFYDMAIILAVLFMESDIDEKYVAFAQEHINAIFQSTQASHEVKAPARNKTSDISRSFNQTVYDTFPKKAISPAFLDYLTNFLEHSTLDGSQIEDIRHFFLRMQRNNKEIRISDLEKRYGIDSSLFSPAVIETFRTHTCTIVQGDIVKEKVTPPPVSDDKEDESDFSQDIDIADGDPCFSLCAALLTDMEYFSREKVLEIFKTAGYQIKDEDMFVIQAEKLFWSPTKKKTFLNSLKNNIRKINAKDGYSTIEIAGGIRIIFSQKNIIDGIYNHGDYEKRIKNI